MGSILRRKLLLRLISVIVLITLISTVPVQAAFWNLTGDVGTHDPTLIKEGNLWWSPYTGKGLSMKYSSDGKTWQNGVQIFESELPWWRSYAPGMGSNDVWAPDIEYYNGRYYMYYCVSEFGKNNSAIGLTSCSSILSGDWRDDGMVISSKNGTNSYNALDPNLVIDTNGSPWLVFGSWFDGLHIVELNKTTMKPKPNGTIYSIAVKSGGIEAGSMIYKDGYYYLFASIGVCCQGVNSTYKIIYGRSKSITGPFMDKNGTSMTNGGGTILDSGNSRWKGPGGQDVYKNGSNYIIARHAYDAENNGNPTLLISDLYFSNGWPAY
ncbi:glycoside hydrolase family 43 protein [Lacrimispora sp.]|uniref:glycoside hydrolase family 43 protein n=1 Tax=Lacrimispora sp. TaxID=2719234 RepID=UPI0029DFA7A7|nr:arabinan endo,5-alpha-L-arabinosidase [Lacrimispora sp.]